MLDDPQKESRGVTQGLHTIEDVEAIFSALPVGVVLIARNGTVLAANRMAEEILGVSADEPIVRDLAAANWQIFKEDGSLMPVEQYPARQVLKGAKVVKGLTMGVQRPQLPIVWISASAAALPAPQDGCVLAFEDITERVDESERRVRLLIALDAAKKETEKASAELERRNRVLERELALASVRSGDAEKTAAEEAPAVFSGELAAGSVLGAYGLVRRLSEGGMGEVWLAEHQLLSRPAAVKLIKKDQLRGDDADEQIKRFEREARITANLTSRNTIELYDFGVTSDGSFYYVMELLEGIDLQDAISSFGPLPAGRVTQLLIQCCSSLAEAHQVGLVHRDIKPANLFVCRLGLEVDVLKVLDFGLVTDSQNSGPERLTRADSFCGTPAYMSPEAARSSVDLTGATDIYALGCVAFWLLTGHHLFEAPNPMAAMSKHLTDPPRRPSELLEDAVPAELEELVMECLHKDPELRPSAEDLWQALIDSQLASTYSMEEAYDWWAEKLEGEWQQRVSAYSAIPSIPPPPGR